jgi:acetyltransferase-like isoleucine patch superfamily enzyme
MKLIFKFFLRSIMYMLYILFPPKMFHFLNVRLNQLYSMWKANDLKKGGSNFNIRYPLYLHGGKYITIGESFTSDLRLRLEAYDMHLGQKFSPSIIIGNNVSINSDCHIGAINNIIIEDGVLIASKVFITDHYHGDITTRALLTPPYERKLFSKGLVKIEKNVWIGEGVVILPNVIIGENSIIGANSVITKNIPKNSVVGGNPAKLIRTL